jgi:hypothetical protein
VLEHFWYTTTGKLTVYNKDITDQHDFDMRNDIHGTRAGTIAGISLFVTELGKR